MSENAPGGTITSIEPQVHNEDRVSIFLDGEFAFGVHEDVVVSHRLAEGDRLSTEARADVERDEAYVQAKQSALDYLAHKARTEQEVRRKLRGIDVSVGVIERVLARLEELGYLDDEAYAHNYVRNRFSNKKYGPIRIRRELVERGVDRSVADEAVADLLGDRDVGEAAWVHAQKRWPRLSDEQDPRRRKQKMYRYLRRRGFSSDTIYTVLDRLERRDATDAR